MGQKYGLYTTLKLEQTCFMIKHGKFSSMSHAALKIMNYLQVLHAVFLTIAHMKTGQLD